MSAAGEQVSYPGARRPDRHREVRSSGIALHVCEWGEADAAPLLLAHGGFDFTGTFDVLAPMLADAGWRVVSWDQRGHGDSDRAALYTWDSDVRDAAAVLDSIGMEPMPFIGHSKGGALVLHLANALPHRVSTMVNLDGLPSRQAMSDVSDTERTRLLHDQLTGWLDHRRSLVGRRRRPGSIDELAERRGRMNPRMSREWLRYLVTVGASRDDDGWRWKIDPTMRMGGFGPWRPEWSMLRLPGVGVPFLGVLGLELEVMGWGTRPDDVIPNLPPGGRLEALPDVGHFVHIEQPRRVADLVLEHLASGPGGGP